MAELAQTTEAFIAEAQKRPELGVLFTSFQTNTPWIAAEGVLAPNAKLHPEIVPGGPDTANATADDHRHAPPHSAPARIRWAQLLKPLRTADSSRSPIHSSTMPAWRS